jgi:hypothetical protein
MHSYLIITLPKINLAEDLASGDPGRKIQHVWKRYVSGSVTRLRQQKSPHGRHVPSFFITICRGLAHGEVERCKFPLSLAAQTPLWPPAASLHPAAETCSQLVVLSWR